jgi:hypothetical protein
VFRKSGLNRELCRKCAAPLAAHLRIDIEVEFALFGSLRVDHRQFGHYHLWCNFGASNLGIRKFA